MNRRRPITHRTGTHMTLDGPFGSKPVGFIGLGHMGSALAAGLARSGHTVVAYDVAGPGRAPVGTRWAEGVAEVAREADVVVLSLPDGEACASVLRELVAGDGRRTECVIDTSTIGVTASQNLADTLSAHGISYVDSPVSGGVAGARARTLMVMYAGTDEACAHAEPVLAALSDRRRRVGASPGQAQALKLANNFLSATALAATSEAIAFGRAAGIDMAVMLEVLNTSSGRSAASSDKFPEHVLTGRYASGFTNSLMAKDVRLYLREAANLEGPAALGAVTAAVWEAFAADEPDVDFTRIYPFVAGTEDGREVPDGADGAGCVPRSRTDRESRTTSG